MDPVFFFVHGDFLFYLENSDTVVCWNIPKKKARVCNRRAGRRSAL